jgi:hypothetical protein
MDMYTWEGGCSWYTSYRRAPAYIFIRRTLLVLHSSAHLLASVDFRLPPVVSSFGLECANDGEIFGILRFLPKIAMFLT